VIGKLVDGKGRIARKLRISVTDKCNFACLFCMPNKNEVKWIPQQDILSFEEIIRITKVVCSLGIVKVRITGGEPLLRKGIEDLIRALRSIDNLKTVDMTTNGWFWLRKLRNCEKQDYKELQLAYTVFVQTDLKGYQVKGHCYPEF
jgi:GTP 3',8-cyclase